MSITCLWRPTSMGRGMMDRKEHMRFLELNRGLLAELLVMYQRYDLDKITISHTVAEVESILRRNDYLRKADIRLDVGKASYLIGKNDAICMSDVVNIIADNIQDLLTDKHGDDVQ